MRKVVVLFAFALAAMAQVQQSNGVSAGVSLANIPASYVLAPGDQFSVRAAEIDEFNGQVFRVDSEGQTTLPVIGKMQTAGLSVEQLEAALVKELKQYVRTPQASVTIVQPRSEPVFLVGAFKSPGVYQLYGQRSLFELLAGAGGLDSTAAHKLRLTRQKEAGMIPLPGAMEDPSGKTSHIDINLASTTETVDPSQNIALKPYDVISVEHSDVIYVSGEVTHVGSLPVPDRGAMTISQAITLSGGFTKLASHQIKILREKPGEDTRAQIDVNVDRILSGKDSDFRLQASDIVLVPNNAGKIAAGRLGSMVASMAIPLLTGILIYH